MAEESLRGLAWKFGDDLDTDQIIPARYCNSFDPQYLADHAMAGIDPSFAQRVAAGDIIVAGRNFGCGSSREVAPLALKAAGIRVIVAHSFARIFYRNAVNLGLLVLECPSAADMIETGEDLVVDPSTRVIHSLTTGKAYQCNSLPQYIQGIIDAGGMVKYIRKKLGKDKEYTEYV
jgi:3-isopropylmalate dehydratase small subunit